MGTLEKRQILITGAAGFVGFHLASTLAADSENDLTLIDDFSRGQSDPDFDALQSKDNVSLVRADLTSPGVFGELATSFDEVYHLAAIIGVKNVIQRPHEVVRVNAVSTLNVLEWFTHCEGGKLLFSSTSESYAWTRHILDLPVPTPEDVPLALTDLSNPRSSYAGSKIFGELCVRQYCHQFDRPFVIVRYHNVYGPRMGQDHVIPELFLRVNGGERPLRVYSPDHQRAFCFVSDAVRATISAMRNDAANGQTLNVGNSTEEITIKDLSQRILSLTNVDASIEPAVAENDPVSRRCPDTRKIEHVISFRPRVNLEKGLQLTIAWYARRHAA